MANLISLIRTCLCLVVVGLLFVRTPEVYWWCFGLTVIVLWMDGLDGYVARKFNESTRAGAVVDILADRIVEQVYWIGFLALGWVPLWIPLVVVVRGVLTDGIRAIALEQGYTAFGETTMMRSPLGVLLVSSRFSRWTYAFTKAVAFSTLIVVHLPERDPGFLPWLDGVAWACVYIAVAFCIVRGLPVLLESPRFLK